MKRLMILLLSMTIFLQNIFASGMAVTDIGSYTYYAQQLKSFNDSVKTALDQLESLNKLNELSDQTNELLDNVGGLLYNPENQIAGIYNGLLNSIDRFKDIGERVNNTNATYFLKNYHNVDEPLKDEIYAKWKLNFEGLFDNSKDEEYNKLKERVDEALTNRKYEQWQQAREELDKYLYYKKVEREQLKKYSLLAPAEYYNDYYMNEKTLEERKKRQETIEKLIKQIDSATDLMQQQQTTNQILIEMLNLIQGQYEMSMMYYNSVSIMAMANDTTNRSYDMKDIEKSRKKFDEEKDKDKNTKPENALQEFMERKTKEAKGSLINKMLGQ